MPCLITINLHSQPTEWTRSSQRRFARFISLPLVDSRFQPRLKRVFQSVSSVGVSIFEVECERHFPFFLPPPLPLLPAHHRVDYAGVCHRAILLLLALLLIFRAGMQLKCDWIFEFARAGRQYELKYFRGTTLLPSLETIIITHGKNDFIKISKNVARYRCE